MCTVENVEITKDVVIEDDDKDNKEAVNTSRQWKSHTGEDKNWSWK